MDDTKAAAAAKRESLMERLNKRHKERQNDLDARQEQRSKANVEFEGSDFFAQTFAERAQELSARLQNINEAAEKKSGGDAPSTDLGRTFNDVTKDIQLLQSYLTTSRTFLTDFKMKSCQTILNDLTVNSDEMRLRLMPKKRFGFSDRKVPPTAADKPKLIIGDKMDSVDGGGAIAMDEQEAKKARMQFDWTLSDRSDERICLRQDELNGKDITIHNVRNCLIELQGHAGSVQILDAVDCVFLCGPIARSAFAENCKNCTITVACQQLRLHTSVECRIYLHVTCRAIIEDCREIEVSVYSYDYDGIAADFVSSGLDRSLNNFEDIADFDWLSSDVPSPNWRLLKDAAPPDWNTVRAKFKEPTLSNVTV